MQLNSKATIKKKKFYQNTVITNYLLLNTYLIGVGGGFSDESTEFAFFVAFVHVI